MNDAPTASAMRFIGKRVQRKEDARLLTGRGTYVDDVVVAGMLHAAFVRSNVARGKITHLDVTNARALAGVVAVYTAQDIDLLGARYANSIFDLPEHAHPDNGLLARTDVRFVGDPVAIVIAQTRAIAEDGAALIDVEYLAETPVIGIDAAKTMAPLHAGWRNNVVSSFSSGDNAEIDAAFAEAAHVVEDTLTNGRQVQMPMEPRGLVVYADGAGELTVHLACQSPHLAAAHIADIFKLPTQQIRVLAKDVGGAFGLKVTSQRDELAVIAAAIISRRPIKWIEDRLENLTAGGQSRDERLRVRYAFDADYRLLAADIEYDVDYGAYPHAMQDSSSLVTPMFPGPYRLPKYRWKSTAWFTNTAGMVPYRGPWMMEMFGREVLLDIAARQMGIDPIELRRKNIISKDDQPFQMPSGIVLTDISPRETMEMTVEAFDLEEFRREQAQARAEGRYIGLGLANGVEPTTVSFGHYSSDIAHLRVELNGKVTATTSTFSQGHGTPTALAQVIADRLGIAFEDVTVMEGDSSRSGFGSGAGGSRQAVAGGGAALVASDMLREKIQRIAAYAFNASTESIRIESGVITVEGSPQISSTIAQIAQMAYLTPDRLPPGMEMGLESQYRLRPPMMVFANATHACVCEVDVETGKVAILRWVAGGDCGQLINPSIVEGQISGGVVQGIAGVLFENFRYDDSGQPMTATLKDYLLPTALDVPRVEFRHMCTPSTTPGGFKGVGEGGAMISPPALVNAIADALAPFRKRWLNMPLSPDRIICGLEDDA